MGFPKALVNIHGVMEVISKAISSKATEMDMEYGMMLLQAAKAIKDTICLIKSMDMVFMTGETDTFTKEISSKTNEMVMDSYSIISSSLMMDIGALDKDVIKMIYKLSKAI